MLFTSKVHRKAHILFVYNLFSHFDCKFSEAWVCMVELNGSTAPHSHFSSSVSMFACTYLCCCVALDRFILSHFHKGKNLPFLVEMRNAEMISRYLKASSGSTEDKTVQQLLFQ